MTITYPKPLIAVVTLAMGIGLVALVDGMRSFVWPGGDTNRAQNALSEISKKQGGAASFDHAVLSCYDLNIIPVWKEIKIKRK